MNILTIHGAFSSPIVFNYIASKKEQANWNHFSYADKMFGLDEVISDATKYLDSLESSVILLTHSLGGIIGSCLLEHENVDGLITLASPLNGIRMPYGSKFFMNRTFVQEIDVYSSHVLNAKKLLEDTDKKVYHIVSTEGFNPFMVEQNDGVVTVNSQLHGKHPKHLVSANHHEILQHDDTLDAINTFLYHKI